MSLAALSLNSFPTQTSTTKQDLGAKRVTSLIQAEYELQDWKAVSLMELLQSIAPEKVTIRLTTPGIVITAKPELQRSISKFISTSLIPNREMLRVEAGIKEVNRLMKEEYEKSKSSSEVSETHVKLRARRLELLGEPLKVRAETSR